ncbi:MAG: VTT domain-containing protein [Phycisphaerales bacterium]|nr:VTT domain-containing protein [Phycisphaerales bacterium]
MASRSSRYHRPTMTAEQRTSLISIFRELGPTGLLGLAWTIVPAVAGITLLAQLGVVAEWLESLGAWGIVIYVVAFALTSGLGLLPTVAQAFLGGWVFGLAMGIPAGLVGFTGGALIGYGIGRVVSQNRVESLIARHKKASTIRNALIGRGYARTLGIVTLLRVPPNSPFALTNLLLSSCRIPLSIYIPSVAIGMLPRTALVVGFGAAAAAKAAETGSEDIQTLFSESSGPSVMIGGLVLLLAIFALISWIANRALEQAAGQSDH